MKRRKACVALSTPDHANLQGYASKHSCHLNVDLVPLIHSLALQSLLVSSSRQILSTPCCSTSNTPAPFTLRSINYASTNQLQSISLSKATKRKQNLDARASFTIPNPFATSESFLVGLELQAAFH